MSGVRRHVFPWIAALFAAAAALAGSVRAGDPPPASAEAASASADAATPPPAPTPPVPPAVGEALPASLTLRALPPAGTAPAEAAVEVPWAELAGDPAIPVVLVFWSSRCPVSARYGATLARLADEFAGRARFVLVASGADETPDAVRRAVEPLRLRAPVYLDTERLAARRLGIRVTPTAFVVDTARALRYRGPLDDDRRMRPREARELVRPALAALLADKPVETPEVRAFGCALR